MKATLFALTTLFALSVAACSSSDSTGGTTPKKDSGTDGAVTSETGGGTDTGTTTEMDTGTTTTDTGGGGTPDDMCAAGGATADECIQCCADNHMDGYNTYISTIIACTCKDTTCKTQCASTLCASSPMNPDTTCQTCFEGMAAQTECQKELMAACTGDCLGFNDCASKCPTM